MRKLLIIISLLFSLASYSQVHQTFGAYVDNLDSLYTHVGRQHQYVIALGRFNANDGFGGIYIWDSSLTTTEVPYLNFKVVGLDTGRWSMVQFLSNGGGGDTTILNNPNYAVLDILSAPPTPTLNAKYIVLTPGSGAWSGHDNNIATGTGVAWTFDTATINQIASNAADNNLYIFNGSAWVALSLNLHQNGERYGDIDIVAGNKQNKAFRFITNDAVVGGFDSVGLFRLNNYGAGNFTGTPTFTLQVDADGNVIEGSGGGSGTVTSVALSMPTGFSVGGSPITTSGTLAVTTSLNGVIHGNGSGFTASNVNLTSEVTGVLPIANGGTNNGSLSVTNGNLIYADGTKLVGLGVGTAGQHLVGGTLPHWVDTSSGGGTTTNALTMNNGGAGDASGTTFDGSAARTISYNTIGAVPTTRTVNGKALSANITLGLASADFANQGTTTTVLHGNAAGNPSFGQIVNADITNSTIDLTAKVTGVLPIANGGTNNGSLSVTAGSIYYGDGSKINAIAAGTTGQVLIGGTTPSWSTNQFFDTSKPYIWLPTTPFYHTFLRNSLGTSIGEVIAIGNNTAAANGAQQYSPAIYQYGQGWGTTGGASQTVGFKEFVLPIQGTTAGATKRWDFYRNGSVVTTDIMDLALSGSSWQLTTDRFFANTSFVGSTISSNGGNTTLTVQSSAASGSGGTSNRMLSLATGTVTQTNGDYVGVSVNPTYNIGSGNAPTTAFRIQPLETALSSGAQYFIEAGTRASSTITSAFTQKWAVDNAGNQTQIGNLTLSVAGKGITITEGTDGRLGSTTLVSGTKAITINGLTTSSRAFVQITAQGGTSTTVYEYKAVCTSNTLTITAIDVTGATVTTDTSVLNYIVFN